MIVVRRSTDAQEVAFNIASHAHVIKLALGQHRDSRLTGGPVEFRHVSARGAAERNLIEPSVDIGAFGVVTPHRFCRQEATRRNGDSFVVNRQRALQSRRLASVSLAVRSRYYR